MWNPNSCFIMSEFAKPSRYLSEYLKQDRELALGVRITNKAKFFSISSMNPNFSNLSTERIYLKTSNLLIQPI